MDILQELCPEALLFTVAVPDYSENPDIKGGVGLTWQNGKYAPYIERFAEKMSPPVMSFDYYPIGNYFDVDQDIHIIMKISLMTALCICQWRKTELMQKNTIFCSGFTIRGTNFMMYRARGLRFTDGAVLYGAKGL